MSRRYLTIASLAMLGAASAAHAPAAEASAADEKLFVERCGMCHREGGMGTGILVRRPGAGAGLLEERRDLLEPFIVAVVRNGSGNMPRIPRGEVSDAELARIAAYLARKEGK
jgi:mono/diheme cytochrome c family protein